MSTRIPLASGTILGRYRIVGLAGEGGMGDIYEAFDTSLERVVALKRIRSAAAGDAAQERFRREALALAQLNHPGICQIYELAETPQGTFIAMEWITGETLHARLDRAALPWREAAELLRQTAEALSAAHAKNLVHRDLKPSNLMITPDGRVKILDFGLVRFADAPVEDPKPKTGEATRLELDPDDIETQAKDQGIRASGSGRSLTRVGSFMGTLGYTSPEQALARPVGPASDLFNLGLLAQEMLTGERAFKGEGRDALDSVVDGVREPLPRGLAPKAFRSLVDRLLLREPKARPTASDTAEELRHLLSPHGALWWSGLSAALVLLIGGTSLWLYSRGVIAGLVKGRPARLAVMGFKNATGVPLLNAQTELGLADLVASRLRTEPKLEVLNADAIAQAAHALKLDPANAAPDDQLRLAKALGADLILSGVVDRKDGKDRLAFLLRDAKGRDRTHGETEAPQLSETMLDATPLAQSSAHILKKAVNPLSKEADLDSYVITPEAFAAYAQGVEAYHRGRYKEAEPLLKQASFAVPEWSKAVATYATVLSQEMKPEADATLNWALVSARKERSSQIESTIFSRLANQALIHRDLSTASTYFSQELRQAEARHDSSGQAWCLNGLGRVAEIRGEIASAKEYYESAMKACERVGDSILIGQVLTNLGNLSLAQGDLQRAAQRYQAVVDTARSIGSESNEALGLNNLGIVLLTEFKPREAQMAFERSLALRDQNGDAHGMVSSFRNLGVNALIEGKGVEAQTWFQRSFDKATAINFSYGQGQAAFYLAEGMRRTGRLEEALKGYRTAIAYSLAAHDQRAVSRGYAAMAECLFRVHQDRAGEAAMANASLLPAGDPYLLRAQAWSAWLHGTSSLALQRINEAIQDPGHDAPELRPELTGLKSRFQTSTARL